MSFSQHAIEWMDDQVDQHKPFFAYIALNAAHEPLQVPAGLRVPPRERGAGERGEILWHDRKYR